LLLLDSSLEWRVVAAAPQVHGSEANTSDTRRAGLAISFMGAESHFRRDVQTFAAREGGLNLDFSSRPLVQVRGRNRHRGNTNFIAAPPDLDVLH
jgi:hypothetical protein